MQEKLIRWDRRTASTLKIAINTFNKKISELQAKEPKSYLPEKLKFEDLKSQIKTENELKRVVKDLRSIRTEGNADLYINEAGQEMTVWEHKQIQKNVKRALARIDKQIEELNKPIEGSKFSRAQMGSVELRTLEARRNNLLKFESKKGYEFERFKISAKFQGAGDYLMKKAYTFMENYKDVLRRYQGFFGYEFLQKQLSRINSPIEFYEKMKNGDEFSVDLTYQSSQTYSYERFTEFLKDVFGEDEFNKWLEEQGKVNEEVVSKTTENHDKKNYKYRLEVNGNPVSYSDSKSTLNEQALNFKGTTQIRIIEN